MPPLRDRTGESTVNNYFNTQYLTHSDDRHKREAGDGVETEAGPAPAVKEDRQVRPRHKTHETTQT